MPKNFILYFTSILLWGLSIFLLIFSVFPEAQLILSQIAFLSFGFSSLNLTLFFKYYHNNKKSSINYLFYSCFGLFAILILFFPQLVIQDLIIKDFYIDVTRGPLTYLVSCYLLFFYTSILYILISRVRSTQDLILRAQLKYFLYSFLFITSLLIGFNWILPVYFNISQTNGLGPILYLIEIGIILNFIKKHRFFDLKRSIQTTLINLSNAIIYGMIFLLILELFYQSLFPVEALLIFYIFTFILTTSFWWKTYEFWRQFWNFIFYHNTQDQQDLVKTVYPVFRHSVQKGIEKLIKNWKLKSGEFISTNKSGPFEELQLIVQNYPNLVFIKEELSYLKINEEDSELLQDEFQKKNISLILPVYFQEKYLGILVLNRHNNNKLFSVQEIDELQNLMQMASSHINREYIHEESKDLNIDSSNEFWKDLMHEVQHPLMIAQNAKNFIEEDQLNESSKKILNTSHSNVQDLSTKFQRITEAIKWQQQNIEIDITEIRLGNILTNILQEFPENVKITSSQVANDCFIRGHESTLMFIFSELIKNSLFFNKNSNKITQLQVKILKKQIIIDMIDNGIGIKKENWENIFKLLFVEAFSRNEKESGLGIGLSLVKSMVKKQGGKISILESGSNGTTIRIIFNIT